MELFLDVKYRYQGGAIANIEALNITHANFTSNKATGYVRLMQQYKHHSTTFILTKELPLPFHILPRDMELFGSFWFDREELSTMMGL